MTVFEARAILYRALPNHSHCINVECWRHSHDEPGKFRTPEYTVSALPGVVDLKCEQAKSKSLSKAVSDVLAIYGFSSECEEDQILAGLVPESQ